MIRTLLVAAISLVTVGAGSAGAAMLPSKQLRLEMRSDTQVQVGEPIELALIIPGDIEEYDPELGPARITLGVGSFPVAAIQPDTDLVSCAIERVDYQKIACAVEPYFVGEATVHIRLDTSQVEPGLLARFVLAQADRYWRMSNMVEFGASVGGPSSISVTPGDSFPRRLIRGDARIATHLDITNEAEGIAKLVELDFCRGCDVIITPRTTKGVTCARAGAVTRCKLPNVKPRKHVRLPVFVSSKKGAKGAKIASDLFVRTGDTRGDHCHHFTGRAQLGGCNRRDNTGGLAVELPFARTFKTTAYPYGVPSAAELVKSGSSWPVHCARACSATLTLEVSRATQRKLKLPSRQIAIGSTRIKKAGLVNPRARLDRRSRAVFRKLGKRSAKVTVRVTVQERRKAAKRFKATGTIRR